MEKKGVHGIQECAGHRDCRRRCGKGGGRSKVAAGGGGGGKEEEGRRCQAPISRRAPPSPRAHRKMRLAAPRAAHQGRPASRSDNGAARHCCRKFQGRGIPKASAAAAHQAPHQAEAEAAQRPHSDRSIRAAPSPPNGPNNRAHQTRINRLDRPPYQGTVIHNQSPTGVWPIRRLGPSRRQFCLRAALLPPNTWPLEARIPQGVPPPRTRASRRSSRLPQA